jgi:hypothetical protein
LSSTGLSERTIRKHRANCWLIGKFESDYGYHKAFTPAIFDSAPAHVREFKRQVSGSDHAVNSYQATWRKLARYVRALGYGGSGPTAP